MYGRPKLCCVVLVKQDRWKAVVISLKTIEEWWWHVGRYQCCILVDGLAMLGELASLLDPSIIVLIV
jgi:hypothetical protein